MKTRATLRDRETGWSYIELITAITVLVFGVLGLAAGFQSSTRIAEENRINNIVLTACNNVLEQIRGATFTEVLTEFGVGSGKDIAYCLPDGSITFTDTPQAIAKGTIKIIQDETEVGGLLTGLLGVLDLDGDGDVLGIALPEDANVWPIIVSFDIPTANGNRQLELQYLLSES